MNRALKYKFLGKKTLNKDLNPLFVQINLQSNTNEFINKSNCHLCSSSSKDDIFNCSQCNTSFCSFCVNKLNEKKNDLPPLYESLKEKRKWVCFKCKDECPCSKCVDNITQKLNQINDQCSVCNRTKNVTKEENIIRMINKNQSVKKEILKYQVFSPLFQIHKNKIFLCYKCKNKILTIFEVNSKESNLIKNKIRITKYPISEIPKDESNDKQKEKVKTFESIEGFISSSYKDIQQIDKIPSASISTPILTQSNSQIKSLNNNINEIINKNDIITFSNCTNNNIKNVNYSNSQNGFIYQSVIPVIQLGTQYVPQNVPQIQSLPQQQQPFQFNNQLLNGETQNEMQQQLMMLLHKSISFFFNNCLQSKLNILENINLLLRIINSEVIENKRNISLQTYYSSFLVYLNKTANEINQELSLLNTSQEQLNNINNQFDINKDLMKTGESMNQINKKSNNENNNKISDLDNQPQYIISNVQSSTKINQNKKIKSHSTVKRFKVHKKMTIELSKKEIKSRPLLKFKTVNESNKIIIPYKKQTFIVN